MTDKPSGDGFLVIVEWDGVKPPTSYYNRLKYMTTRVRGDDSIGPIARRSQNNHGSEALILQEGVFLCSDLSQAKVIAMIAQNYGAAYVQISETTVIADNIITATGEDVAAMERVTDILGKRGHPYDERTWAVTCLVDVVVNEEVSRGVIKCPACGATAIRVREGSPAKYSVPTDVGTFEAWARLRFFNGSYEVPLLGKGYKKPPANYKITNNIDKDIFDLMAASDFEKLDYLTFRDGFAILDAIFLSRLMNEHAYRQKRRVQAIAYTLINYPDAGGIRMAERSDVVDLFDASSRYNPQYIAAWWLQMHNATKTNNGKDTK